MRICRLGGWVRRKLLVAAGIAVVLPQAAWASDASAVASVSDEIVFVSDEAEEDDAAKEPVAYHTMAAPVAVSCAPPWWAHRNSAFAEFLLLRPGSTDLIYAVEQVGPAPGATPTGPVGIAAIDEAAGFRTGFSLAASNCSSLVVSYAWWQGDTNNTINSSNGVNVLYAQVLHPSLLTAGGASLSASSSQDITFQTLDLAYRHLWKTTNNFALNWQGGLRYGNLEQTSRTQQTVQVAQGLATVVTDIDFDGFGISGGLDFERYSCASGLSIYGKSLLSLLAGEWDADYRHSNQIAGGPAVNRVEDFRISPVADVELGLAWTCLDSHVRVHAGWMASAWYNAMVTRDYIDSVRSGRINDISDTLTFSGLTTGFEFRY